MPQKAVTDEGNSLFICSIWRWLSLFLHGERLEAAPTNFLWLFRTNCGALCVFVWVAHLALQAGNQCVYFWLLSVFPGTHIYLCASKCVFPLYAFVPVHIHVRVNAPMCSRMPNLCACNMCVLLFHVCVCERDGGGAALLTQPLCHADISRVAEIITLGSP